MYARVCSLLVPHSLCYVCVCTLTSPPIPHVQLEDEPVEGTTLSQWQSNLVFPDLVPGDSNLYTCNVFDNTRSSAPQLVSVQLNVNPGTVCVCVCVCVCACVRARACVLGVWMSWSLASLPSNSSCEFIGFSISLLINWLPTNCFAPKCTVRVDEWNVQPLVIMSCMIMISPLVWGKSLSEVHLLALQTFQS